MGKMGSFQEFELQLGLQEIYSGLFPVRGDHRKRSLFHGKPSSASSDVSSGWYASGSLSHCPFFPVT